jgi:O-antigen/teichoic acid export membrane protein
MSEAEPGVRDIKIKALSNARWMIVISVVSVLCAYITNLILGNISPETLGIYSALNIFLSSLTAFTVPGGPVVLSSLCPKIYDKGKKGGLFNAYAALSAIMYGVFIVVMLTVPQLSGPMERTGSIRYTAFFIMAPVFLAMTLVSCLLTSALEARISNLMTKSGALLLAAVLTVCAAADSSIIEKYLPRIFVACTVSANLLALFAGLLYVKKHKIIAFQKMLYIPKGFWPFVMTSFLLSIQSFLYRNADRMFVALLGSMNQLGYYQAIISVLMLVEYVPSLLGNITIPYFSEISGSGAGEVVRSYENTEKYMLLFLLSIALGVMGLSGPLLSMFGEGYTDFRYLLIILIAAKCVSSRGFMNTPMLIALEKNRVRLLNGTAQTIIQFVITLLTIGRLGILGVVLGRTAGLCLSQIAPWYVVRYKSGYNIRLSRAYRCGVPLVCAYGLLCALSGLADAILIAAGIAVWLVFLRLGGFGKSDLPVIKRLIFGRINIGTKAERSR